MKNKIISILLCSFIIISLMGCGNTTKTTTNINSTTKQEESKEDKAKTKYIAILESGKTYEEMDDSERAYMAELIGNWDKQDQEFKNKYKSKKEFVEKSMSEAIAKWKIEDGQKTKTADNIPEVVTSRYKAKFGQILEANKLGATLTIKFKIKPSYNNQATIHQNGYNVEDLILNQNADQYDTINYWAVADMEDGSEGKVVSFTLNKSLIQDIKSKNLAGIRIVDSAKDVWILSSLKN